MATSRLSKEVVYSYIFSGFDGLSLLKFLQVLQETTVVLLLRKKDDLDLVDELMW